MPIKPWTCDSVFLAESRSFTVLDAGRFAQNHHDEGAPGPGFNEKPASQGTATLHHCGVALFLDAALIRVTGKHHLWARWSLHCSEYSLCCYLCAVFICRDGERLVILVFFLYFLPPFVLFKVVGGVLLILHNKSCRLEMCVDSWPTFAAAICYRQEQEWHTARGRKRIQYVPQEWPADVCTRLWSSSAAALRWFQTSAEKPVA